MNMMSMMNNPLIKLVQLANSGGDPIKMLNMIAPNNPQIAQVMQLINGKDANQLQAIAQNMAKERGISIEEIAQSLGLNMPQ